MCPAVNAVVVRLDTDRRIEADDDLLTLAQAVVLVAPDLRATRQNLDMQTTSIGEAVGSRPRSGVVDQRRLQHVVHLASTGRIWSPFGAMALGHGPLDAKPSRVRARHSGIPKTKNPSQINAPGFVVRRHETAWNGFTCGRSSPGRNPSMRPASRPATGGRSRTSRASTGSTFPSS